MDILQNIPQDIPRHIQDILQLILQDILQDILLYLYEMLIRIFFMNKVHIIRIENPSILFIKNYSFLRRFYDLEFGNLCDLLCNFF